MMNTMHSASTSKAASSSRRWGWLGTSTSAVPSRRRVIRRFKEDAPEQPTEAAPQKIKVSFKLPHHVEFGENLCVVGAVDTLGTWDVSACVPMCWNEGDVWTAEAEVPVDAGAVEYKYVIKAEDQVQWMPCDNRVLEIPGPANFLNIEDDWYGTTHNVITPEQAAAAAAAAEAEAAADVDAVPTEDEAAAAEEEDPASVAAKAAIGEAPAVIDTPSADDEPILLAEASEQAAEKPYAAVEEKPEKPVSAAKKAEAAVPAAKMAAEAAAAKQPKARKPSGGSASSNGNGNGASSNGASPAKGGFSKLFNKS